MNSSLNLHVLRRLYNDEAATCWNYVLRTLSLHMPVSTFHRVSIHEVEYLLHCALYYYLNGLHDLIAKLVIESDISLSKRTVSDCSLPALNKRINASLRSLAVNREQCSRDRADPEVVSRGANNGELLSYPFPSPLLPFRHPHPLMRGSFCPISL